MRVSGLNLVCIRKYGSDIVVEMGYKVPSIEIDRKYMMHDGWRFYRVRRCPACSSYVKNVKLSAEDNLLFRCPECNSVWTVEQCTFTQEEQVEKNINLRFVEKGTDLRTIFGKPKDS